MKTRLLLSALLLSATAAGQFFGGLLNTDRIKTADFANLGTPPDSHVRYCSNCQQTNPCTSGGPGAYAFRRAGTWDCAMGGEMGAVQSWTDLETPSGTVNGSNVTFTLVEAPTPSGSLLLFRNGLLQRQGIDYTLSGLTITFSAAPLTGDLLSASYRSLTGAPGDPVTSVNGETGDVVIDAADIGLGNVPNYGVASQAEAEAGSATNKLMTPQRTAQAVAATHGNVPNYGVASQAEAEAGSATNKLMTPQRTAQAIAALAGGGGSPIDPLLQHQIIETFCGFNSLGSQGNKNFIFPWYNAIGSGTSSFQAGSAGKPCVVRLQANASSTGVSALYLYGQSPRPYVDLTNSAWPNWTATLRATLNHTSNVRFYFGANSSESMPFNGGNYSGFGISFNTQRSDTTSWRYSVWTNDGETGSANNSGVAVGTSERVFRIRKLATQKLGFSVSSDGGATYSTEYTICPGGGGCDLTGTPPTAAVSWWISMQGNNDPSAVNVDADHFTFTFDTALPR